MKKIHELPRKKADNEIVKSMKLVMAGLKSGEITEVALVAVKRGGFISTCHTSGDRFRLIGGLDYAKDRILTCLREDG